jgi:hypothetical protein
MAQRGDVDGIKTLFSRGLASPLDISAHGGRSLVLVSTTTTFGRLLSEF